MALFVNPVLCPQSYRCPLPKICPVGAITQSEKMLPVIDMEKCNECGLCKMTCPARAVIRK